MSEEESFAEYLKKKYAAGNIEAVMNSDKIFFNEGVDACIAKLKNKHHGGAMAELVELIFRHLIEDFEQLKKPLP